MTEAEEPDDADDGRVPWFGTWPAIYAAVVVCALASMALVVAFQSWSW